MSTTQENLFLIVFIIFGGSPIIMITGYIMLFREANRSENPVEMRRLVWNWQKVQPGEWPLQTKGVRLIVSGAALGAITSILLLWVSLS